MAAEKILMIEDDVEFADGVVRCLKATGYEVELTHNWFSAMRALNADDITAIIADVETPTGNGLTAMEFLNQDIRIDEIPKVFVTGLNDDETIARCEKLGALHLHKSHSLMPKLQQFLRGVGRRDHADQA